jgi:hypothetical protein
LLSGRPGRGSAGKLADAVNDAIYAGLTDTAADWLYASGTSTSSMGHEPRNGVSVNTEAFSLFVTYGDHRRVASIAEPVDLNGL